MNYVLIFHFKNYYKMNRWKKFLRILRLIVLILLVSCGLGVPVFNTRETYKDREVKIEMSESRKDEDESETEMDEQKT